MDLTNAEKKVLQGISFNTESIENGELDDKELALLHEMRAVDAYLHKKYTDYTFEITGCEPMAGTARDYDEWFYTIVSDEENSENVSAYIARARGQEGDYEITDDFYGELIQGSITRSLRNTAAEAGFTVIDAKIHFWEHFGENDGHKISAMDVLTGKVNAGNDIKIFLDGSTLKSSYEEALATLEKAYKDKGFVGDVYVVILSSAEGDLAKDRVFSGSFRL